MARLRPKERPELLKAREDAEHFVEDSDRVTTVLKCQNDSKILRSCHFYIFVQQNLRYSVEDV